MKKLKPISISTIALLIISILLFSCKQKLSKKGLKSEINISVLKKEIELRLRDYERYLKNRDSIGLGNMYMKNAEIIPSTVGRKNIIKAFGSMIRDSITGSEFKTTNLWGNNQLLVEEGKGIWFRTDGTVVGRGKYLLVWKKESGKWKILRDTWFPDKEN
ncbi:MAG: nuclear transport factor 2 family protein [Lutibacter sp.]